MAASAGVPGSQALQIGMGVLAMIPAVVQMVQSFNADPSDENAEQLRQARDALAGRLAQETGMPMEQAHQMLSEHLGDAVQAAGQGGDDNTLSAILSGAMAGLGALGAYKGVKGMRAGKGSQPATPAGVAPKGPQGATTERPAAPQTPAKNQPMTADEWEAERARIGPGDPWEGSRPVSDWDAMAPQRAAARRRVEKETMDADRQRAEWRKTGFEQPVTQADPGGGRAGAMAADSLAARMAKPGMGLPYERGFIGPPPERGFVLPNRPRGSGRPPRTIDAEFELLPGTELPGPPQPAGLLPWEDYGAMERNRLLGSMYRYEGG
jgi:hypothetical protein